MITNKNYKDTLFRLIFSNPKDLLMLYNAINNTDYKDETLLQITTLEDAVYIGMKNDISFIICHTMNLFEQQSSQNPNMPLRGLLYFGKLYQQYVEETNANIYGSKLISLPTPRYIVFCNYESMSEERQLLRLSDCFINSQNSKAALECTAELININYGHNSELMLKCRMLQEYAEFIHLIRASVKSCTAKAEAGSAITRVVKECISKDILKSILQNNYSGVSDLLLEEFDKEKYLELMSRDAREDGFAKGHAEGLTEAIYRFISNSLSDSASKEHILMDLQKYFNLDENDAIQYYEKCTSH